MFHQQSCHRGLLEGKKKKIESATRSCFQIFSEQKQEYGSAEAATLSQPLYVGYFYSESR